MLWYDDERQENFVHTDIEIFMILATKKLNEILRYQLFPDQIKDWDVNSDVEEFL